MDSFELNSEGDVYVKLNQDAEFNVSLEVMSYQSPSYLGGPSSMRRLEISGLVSGPELGPKIRCHYPRVIKELESHGLHVSIPSFLA